MKTAYENIEFTALMERAGWSAAETARRLGLSKGILSGYTTGKKTPPPSTLELMRMKVMEYVGTFDRDSVELGETKTNPTFRSGMKYPQYQDQVGTLREMPLDKSMQELREIATHAPESAQSIQQMISTTYKMVREKRGKPPR